MSMTPLPGGMRLGRKKKVNNDITNPAGGNSGYEARTTCYPRSSFNGDAMKEIKLTQDKVDIVDDADFERLNKHKWYALKDHNTFYAVRSIYLPCGKMTLISMHREILGLGHGDPQQGDHRNHNGLDNRRDNLRICTNSQNQHNQKPYKNCSSAYKGVFWHKRHNKWQAQITFNDHSIHLGYFNSEIDAAKAYDRAAIEYFGEFAHMNLP